MESATTALVWFDQARQALMQAKSFDEVKKIRDKAEALRLYTKQAGDGLEMQNWCAEIKLRAERRAGELLAEQVSPGNPLFSHPERISLDDLGIDHNQSHRWQAIARLPAPKFEEHIATIKAAGRELTSAGVFRESKRHELAATADTPPFPTTAYRCLVID